MESCEMGLRVLRTSEGNFGPYKHGWYHGLNDLLRELHWKLPGWRRRFLISLLAFACLVLQIPTQFLIRMAQFVARDAAKSAWMRSWFALDATTSF